MTVTDELRRLLDERGVKWFPIAWNPKRETFYHAANGVGFCADEYTDGVKIYTDATITPEQAVEATLGRRECRMDYLCDGYLYFRSYWCRECDERFAYRLIGHDDALPKYCPNCGAKVVAK